LATGKSCPTGLLKNIRAKQAGTYKWRKPTAHTQAERAMELLTQGMTRKAAVQEVGRSVHRVRQNSG
jgi:hypothetical protein